VPKSKVRKKSDVSLRERSAAIPARAVNPSPAWYPIVMAVVLVLGLAWMVVYYLAGEKVPLMTSLGAWNFAVGFGVMLVGLIMAVRWR
jgi:membrane protein YdbS with pleckstrin-like domain